MKQKKSVSTKGKIEIKTQKLSYFSNQTIVGWVFLKIKEAGFMAGTVQLRFVGKDNQTHMFNTQDYGSFRLLNKKFINSTVHLHSFGNELPVVQMVFPFEISLNLFASSMKIGTGLEETIIEFYLAAEVVYQFLEKNKLDTQIKFKLPIEIYKAFSDIALPIKNIYREAQSCFFCFNKDHFSQIKLEVAKNEFQQGDTVTINVEIDQSNSTQDLDMSISLIKTQEFQFQLKYETTKEIKKFDHLRCKGGQKYNENLYIDLHTCTESTAISTFIQLQYFIKVRILNSEIEYKFPITIIKQRYLLPYQIYNYNDQNSAKNILFDQKARLFVDQTYFLKQTETQLLSQYNNQQTVSNQQQVDYHGLEMNKPQTTNGNECPVWQMLFHNKLMLDQKNGTLNK